MSSLFSYEQLFRFAFPDWKDPIPALRTTWNSEDFQSHTGLLEDDFFEVEKDLSIKIPEDVNIIIWEVITNKNLSNFQLSNIKSSFFSSNSIQFVKIHFQTKTKAEEISYQSIDIFPNSNLVFQNLNCFHFLPNAIWVYSLDHLFFPEIHFIDPYIGFWLLDSSKYISDDLFNSIPHFLNGSYNFPQFFNEIEILIQQLQKNNLENWLNSIEMPFLNILSRIPSISMNINQKIAIEIQNTIKTQIKEINKSSFSIAQRQFNLLSPFEVSDIIYSLKSIEQRLIIQKYVEENEDLNSLLSQIDSLLSISKKKQIIKQHLVLAKIQLC